MLADTKKTESEARVLRTAEFLGRALLLDRFPEQLSGGKRQRVELGRAIARDLQVFLFEDPLSNNDAKLRLQMRNEIKSLHQRLKTTSVYVTHYQIEAMTMVNKIVVMHDGCVEQIGDPLDLYKCPVKTIVACFIGSPPIMKLSGKIRHIEGKTSVELLDKSLVSLKQHRVGFNFDLPNLFILSC